MNRLYIIYLILLCCQACGSSEEPNIVNQPDNKTKSTNDSVRSLQDSLAKTEALPAVQIKGKKGKVLKSCIGLYQLRSIEASVGANGMMDYVKEANQWVAKGSSISDGMRESYDINLDKKTISSLNNLQIEVDNNLNIKILVQNKVAYEIPYQENELDFHLKKNGEYYISLPDNLTKSSTFSGSFLYLLASDEVGKSLFKKLDILEIYANVIVLRYNQKEAQFELNLFYGECCDNSFYYFSKLP
jgi:hypothetical protein